MRTIKVLAQAIDARDHYTHSHSENVAKYAVVIAEEMGLPVNEIEIIREPANCTIWVKSELRIIFWVSRQHLTEEEWEQIKRHPINRRADFRAVDFFG